MAKRKTEPFSVVVTRPKSLGKMKLSHAHNVFCSHVTSVAGIAFAVPAAERWM